MPPDLEPARVRGYYLALEASRAAVAPEDLVPPARGPGHVRFVPADQFQVLEDHLNGVGTADALGHIADRLRALD